MREKIINFVLFQVGWFACVLSAAAKFPLLGVLLAVCIITLHIWRAQYSRKELYLILLAMSIGGAWDSMLVQLQWLKYSSGMLLPGVAPYWIIVMWALFATTLNVSLRWMKHNYVTASLLGAVAGPLAYSAGAGLGALQFVNPNQAFMALAIGWAVFTPLLLRLATRLDGYPVSAGGEFVWK